MPFFIQEINLQTGWKGHIIQLQRIQEAAWKKPWNSLVQPSNDGMRNRIYIKSVARNPQVLVY